jgi:flagellar basal-body rod modification protein FlgD
MNVQSIFAASNLARAQDSTSNTNNTTSTSNSSQSTSLGELNGNDFITLLAAQLQAQDPTNPLDPNQMVDELTSMNSLQQLIGIKQDLDTMLGTAGSSSSTSGSNANAVAAYTHPDTLNASHEDYVIQQKLFPAQTPAN